ncbi:hypothetical protein MYCTH_114667 [Thermothelomyces thermophilus ATCC 42464]|uniref:Diels-Alderase mycB n=1 Tax=Thermothelomyces thermophilus (strain ATCC 42464 / BCRC 31852 / DSM 1799) TaxID=573729 RepID=MYCB_THET4|nr:uncharacterized protein MYCTH_114667 [Thermothelomyces thermophilus ATCC 42464]G2Q9A6.1 RecName: Full=Diels-Alderase mycB; AltName: Full=Myceliothermophin biosynthesis cluster protein B; Flags: Precursor [Thermothelomyces thermophilus ATCC 42464]AEO57198.1 hypothetical protein MYCTH_114667 [Thermothelomyces thermophilus ATCC 42464]
MGYLVKLACGLLLPLATADVNLAQQPFGEFEWQPKFDTPSGDHTSCAVSRLSAYEVGEGPVSFSLSPTEHPEIPKLSTINSTVWEQWEFDAVSESGTGSVLMGFSRDPSYSFFGQGNLRVEFYMTLEDGTRIQELEYTESSTVIDCPDSIRGIWNSSDRSYAFEISRDMQRARVWWDTGREKGSIAIESTTTPHLADGEIWPPEEGESRVKKSWPSVKLSPGLYMSQPIAGGKVTAHVQIGKKTMSITGYGAHSRLWAENSWFKICRGWQIMRGFLGPYTISYWRPLSRLDDWVPYFAAHLFKHGRLVFTSQVGAPSQQVDYTQFHSDFSGNVSGSLADKATGRVLEFVSPSTGKTWRFHHRHFAKMFEMGFGGGRGLTGFLDEIVGGEVGTDEEFTGRGFSEQVLLPDEIKQWQIWVVYGIGFLGRWKNTVTNLVLSIW